VLSASEKLWALADAIASVDSIGSLDQFEDRITELQDALSEIVAVVEAAEFYFGELRAGRPALTIGIEQALATLDKKLP
jgi:hypothetical protein